MAARDMLGRRPFCVAAGMICFAPILIGRNAAGGHLALIDVRRSETAGPIIVMPYVLSFTAGRTHPSSGLLSSTNVMSCTAPLAAFERSAQHRGGPKPVGAVSTAPAKP